MACDLAQPMSPKSPNVHPKGNVCGNIPRKQHGGPSLTKFSDSWVVLAAGHRDARLFSAANASGKSKRPNSRQEIWGTVGIFSR